MLIVVFRLTLARWCVVSCPCVVCQTTCLAEFLEYDGIHAATVTQPDASATWYTVDGLRLDAKPATPGVYVVNGQKVIIK